MAKIAPSLLAADLCRLDQVLAMLERQSVSLIHLDIMDGHYVPNITFGVNWVKSIAQNTTIPLDVHLMVEDPDRFALSFIDAGASYLSFHLEACCHPLRLKQKIVEAGALPGLALNPATPLSELEFLWEEFELLLLMSVNPGFFGQSFIPQVLRKIQAARQRLISLKKRPLLEVDGGIDLCNVHQLIEGGVDIIVVGAGIFSQQDPEKALSQFMAL